MNISVLGCGNIGGTIGGKWAAAGHMVAFGVRHPEQAETQALVRSLGPNAWLGSDGEAIARGEVVLFAIPGSGVEETVARNAGALRAKTLIDATNRIGQQPPNSLAAFTRHLPDTPLYRAFNHLGWENFKDPRYGDQVADLFFCGTAGPGRAVVEGLIRDVGLNPIYIGGLDQSGQLDGLLLLWMALVRGQGMGRGVAFKLLRRS
jgi:predicted dinucleotide-binding enzyme